MKHHLFNILLLTAVVTHLCSCIKENMDHCYHDLQLRFECINRNYLFEEEVKEINLLFYTPEGILAYDLVYTREELKQNGWKVTLSKQKEGNYTLITHVNYQNGHTTVRGKERKETLQTEIQYDNNRNVQYNLTDTWYGGYELTIDYMAKDPEHTIMLSKNTNQVILRVLFANEAQYKGVANLNIDIKGTNALYGWDNREITHPPVKYYAPTGVSHDDRQLLLKNINSTMRIQTWSDLTLELSFNTLGTQFRYAIDLPREIIKMEEEGIRIHDTDEKLEHYDRFEFEIKIGEDQAILHLKLNGWYLIRQNDDL